MTPQDLLRHARRLSRASVRRPRQADLRRAVSAAYYALFHAIAGIAADTMVGTSQVHRGSETWRHVYRSLEHSFAKSQCVARNTIVPLTLRDVANAFVVLQEGRHLADYDPFVSFFRRDVDAYIQQAEQAVTALEGASTADRRTFAVALMLRSKA
jgi:hypothetical protein